MLVQKGDLVLDHPRARVRLVERKMDAWIGLEFAAWCVFRYLTRQIGWRFAIVFRDAHQERHLEPGCLDTRFVAHHLKQNPRRDFVPPVATAHPNDGLLGTRAGQHGEITGWANDTNVCGRPAQTTADSISHACAEEPKGRHCRAAFHSPRKRLNGTWDTTAAILGFTWPPPSEVPQSAIRSGSMPLWPRAH
jgi:hypothetical protein